MLRQKSFFSSLTAAAGVVLTLSGVARADHREQWTKGELVLAGAGCPIETPDGLSLMVASGRPGGQGGLDIWVLDRTAIGAPWSAPKNLPAPINSAAADFCPAPFERSLFFISAEANPGTCSVGDGGDIYLSRQSPAGDWSEPEHLPCAPDGPNTAGTERSPSLITTWYGTFLFYSTNGGVAGADDDIYVSVMHEDGKFGPGHVVRALSRPGYQDQMPTVREINGRFEITFNSDRPGTLGGQDAYLATARFLPFWWSQPENAGPNVNTAANETRASLSADGSRLYVGRGDVYVSERK